MNEKQNFYCRHNPLGLSNGIVRFLRFTFHRKVSMSEFSCGICGTAVSVPKLYSNALIRFVFFTIALITTVFVCIAIRSESMSAAALFLGLPVTLYIMYRLITAAILAFGNWVPVENEDDLPQTDYQRKNSVILSACFLGINVAYMNLHSWRISIAILIFAVLLVVALLFQKKWIQAVVAMLFLVYGAISQVLLTGSDTVVTAIDNLVLFVQVFFLLSPNADKKARHANR